MIFREITDKDLLKIRKRIDELKKVREEELGQINTYSRLTDQEKIPFRVLSAEILALESMSYLADMDEKINWFVEREMFTAAEGMRRANKWLKDNLNNASQYSI